ncbi:MAG: lysine--tRNA ligase, partial [Burkholderiaceae bacterium]
MPNSPAHNDPTSRHSSAEDTAEQSGFDENQIMAERRLKLDRLRDKGVPAFPNDIRPTHRAQALHGRYEHHTREQLESEHVEVSIAGRMMLKRIQGK